MPGAAPSHHYITINIISSFYQKTDLHKNREDKKLNTNESKLFYSFIYLKYIKDNYGSASLFEKKAFETSNTNLNKM